MTSQVTGQTARGRVQSLSPAVASLSPAERASLGKAARKAVPRSRHAELDLTTREDPIELLEQQAARRVPELVPVRYGRMLASEFSYFRGAALPMASDLARTPACGLQAQLCGDAHLSNFGAFASPERRLIFSINDFDETAPGPWEWDVKRLAASMEVAARDHGFSRKHRRAIVTATVRSYREAIREFAGLGNLAVWYAHLDLKSARRGLEAQMSPRQRRQFRKDMTKAQRHDNLQAFSKLAVVDGTSTRIRAVPPLIVPLDCLVFTAEERDRMESAARRFIPAYVRSLDPSRRGLLAQYEFADMARKVVGVGSVGTRCWVILMRGRDRSDPLLLQVKEAEESVLCRYGKPSKLAREGERVVVGQRTMQAVSDIFLGWAPGTATDGQTHDYYVRQLRDWKLSFDVGEMLPPGLRFYGELCGWTLARAHARSGDRIAIAAYLGSGDRFDRAVAEFADAYADLNARDYQALIKAVAERRIFAERDV
ncbi:MAG TPA: DUF2252 domain-containing protein [Streptosporangiaceae bacterium]|jgi:uncharacterized protein (DUF2252 family)